MRRPDAGSVLGRSLLVWGLGHLALGLTLAGRALMVTELVAIALVTWLTVGLIDTSAYLVPYLAGVLFLVGWTWQAVDAYRIARRLGTVGPDAATPVRSPAVAIGWLSIPLLAWSSGFWLAAAEAASPAATLDRFVTAWEADALDAATWGRDVVEEARAATDRLGDPDDGLRDVRIRVVEQEETRATALAEAVHYERRSSRVLGLFAGSELVPVADRALLRLELVAEEAGLPGGGGIGAVRWSIVGADADP